MRATCLADFQEFNPPFLRKDLTLIVGIGVSNWTPKPPEKWVCDNNSSLNYMVAIVLIIMTTVSQMDPKIIDSTSLPFKCNQHSESAGLAGVSSEVGLDEGLLVCT